MATEWKLSVLSSLTVSVVAVVVATVPVCIVVAVVIVVIINKRYRIQTQRRDQEVVLELLVEIELSQQSTLIAL